MVDVNDKAREFLEQIGVEATAGRIKALSSLLTKHIVIGVREALSDCEGQLHEAFRDMKDDYRNGQWRGAYDCISVISRLVDRLEGNWPSRKTS